VLPAPCRAGDVLGELELGGCPELPEDDPAHERLLFSANDWPLASRVRSAARRGRSDSRTCSSQAWAPAPRGPRPSSVGTPAAALRFPSEAPPTPAAPISQRSAAAAACARAYRAWDAGVGSIGGRSKPPRGSTLTRASAGRYERSAASTRSASARDQTRTSIETVAFSGTTFVFVPADATVAVTVVPSPGRPTPSRNTTKRASSARADAPFSG